MSFVFAVIVAIVTFPAFVFCMEVLAAMTARWPETLPPKGSIRPRVAVLVPAHNESIGLRDTVDDIRKQLHSADRVLVVADNCTDDTATVARSAGAEVTERHDTHKIGKGYALHWGLTYLGADPPEIVIIIDADCRIGSHSIG